MLSEYEISNLVQVFIVYIYQSAIEWQASNPITSSICESVGDWLIELSLQAGVLVAGMALLHISVILLQELKMW
jgi:hypothetical protein